jgi:hypothetical protein
VLANAFIRSYFAVEIKTLFMSIRHLPTVIIWSVTSLLSSCQKETSPSGLQEESSALNPLNNNAREHSKKIYVNNVNELYTAINDPGNPGTTIVLGEGTYMLSAAFPKGGRLELQNNMSLVGQPGHPELVVIDITNLPLTSFNLPGSANRTGAIRLGDGRNSLEWITFQNDPAHTVRSLIQTDIVTTPVAQVKVAHCIVKGSSIGLSILNRDPVANGRLLEADIEDNEFAGNIVQQFGSGIQVQNTTISDAVIRLRMSRNHIHGNKAGMLIFSSSAQRCEVDVKSFYDKIENNGIGIVLDGGFILTAAAPTIHNKLLFEAHATEIKNNTGTPAPPFAFPATGIHAAAGQSMPPFDGPGTAHFNELEINLIGCSIAGNSGNQINAYGAHSFHPSSIPAGTHNKTNVYLSGLSTNASVNSINSFPSEPALTNSVNVYR